MSRRAALLIVLGLAVLVGACQGPRSAGPEHNVILVVIDSLRADHVGCYGYAKPTTPALDAFAAKHVRFTQSYATSSWTLPSHVSMFTGLYEDVHRAYSPNCSLDSDNVLLAEVLRQAKYDTHAIVCAPFLRAAYLIDRGFVNYDEEIARTKRPNVRQIKTSRRVTDKALDYLKKREKNGGPFFLFVHYWDVHYDYNPPPEYTKLFDPDYRGTITADNYSRRDDIVPGIDPRDLQHIVALYDGEIRYVDDHLRELLTWLERSPLAKNTAIIITSDHGEEFLEHRSTGHNFTCYEELTRVPLVIAAPWLTPRSRTVDTLVENVDLFPTILALAGVRQPPGKINGYDLLPLITAGQAPSRNFFYCETRAGRRYGWHGTQGMWSSVRDVNGLKVLKFRGRGERATEMYDLAADPGEQADLSASPSETGSRLDQTLEQLRAAHNHLARERNLDFQEPTAELRDAGVNDQLKTLGYVQ